MATHSSILAWKIPWTEDPGGPLIQKVVELDTTEQLSTSKMTGPKFHEDVAGEMKGHLEMGRKI